jgi:hypothetical protein
MTNDLKDKYLLSKLLFRPKKIICYHLVGILTTLRTVF